MQAGSIQKELGFSFGLHAIIILAGLIYLPGPDEFLVPDNALPVELISIEAFTQLVKESQAEPEKQEVPVKKPLPPKPQPPKPQPPKPQLKEKTAEQVISAPPAVPSTLAATPPATPAADAMPALEPEKQPVKKTETTEEFVNLVAAPRPMPRPERRPVRRQERTQAAPDITPEQTEKTAPEKSFLDTAAVQALLDKTPDEVAPPVVEKPIAEYEKLSLSEIDAFRAQMKQCWTVPAGAANADDLAVRVSLGLNLDGSLASGPFVVNKGRIGDPYFRAAAESVLRAIRRCQPFQMPADKYRSWQKMELNFDPKKMFGG